MSFGSDNTTAMQGATSSKFGSTLLGADSDETPPPTNPVQGKKPKQKTPAATFLGADAQPPSAAGGKTLLGAA